MSCGDYVITEAGFGADLGAEKFFNIKCRKSGLKPDLTVLVATLNGLKMHGGTALEDIQKPDAEGVRRGFANLDRHIRNLQSFGQTVIVCFNKYASDTAEEIQMVKEHCAEFGVPFALNNAWAEGGAGAIDLANLVVETIDTRPSGPLQFTYSDDMGICEKISAVAKKIYGAELVTFSSKARKKIAMAEQIGASHFPVCIAKTQYSFSQDPTAYGAPEGFEFDIKDIVINTGSEMIVAIAGDIIRMPGLPRVPQAMKIDIVNGQIEGLS
jgi:formate--tetrahydrofolate ligase